MICFFFFKQKTAYELRISDWSSDVCSSDLRKAVLALDRGARILVGDVAIAGFLAPLGAEIFDRSVIQQAVDAAPDRQRVEVVHPRAQRSEEHPSELQSLMRTSYAVFCLKKIISSHIEDNNYDWYGYHI